MAWSYSLFPPATALTEYCRHDQEKNDLAVDYEV